MTRETIYPSRADARAEGGRFYRGATCKRGHVDAVRYVTNKACKLCSDHDAALRHGLVSEAEREAERARKREARLTWDSVERGYEARRAIRATPEGREAARRQRADYAARDPNGVIARQREERAAKAFEREIEREERRLAKAAAKADRTAARKAALIGRQTVVTRKKHRRYVRERDAPGSHTIDDARALLEAQGGQCSYCGVSGKLQKDHKVSLASGLPDATNDIDNIQWLCKPCNTQKWQRLDCEERVRRGLPAITPWDGWLGRALWLGLIAA